MAASSPSDLVHASEIDALQAALCSPDAQQCRVIQLQASEQAQVHYARQSRNELRHALTGHAHAVREIDGPQRCTGQLRQLERLAGRRSAAYNR